MGIEPTYSAWKAEVLPLNYTRAAKRRFVHQNRYNFKIWWRGEDSNLRRLSRQIYSLIPLATREPLQARAGHSAALETQSQHKDETKLPDAGRYELYTDMGQRSLKTPRFIQFKRPDLQADLITF